MAAAKTVSLLLPLTFPSDSLMVQKPQGHFISGNENSTLFFFFLSRVFVPFHSFTFGLNSCGHFNVEPKLPRFVFFFFLEDPSEMRSAHPCSKSSHSWSRCPGQAFPNVSPCWSIRRMETQSPTLLLSPLSWRLVLSRLLSCPRRSTFMPFWTLFGHRLYIM